MSQTTVYSSDLERIADLEPITVKHGPVSFKEIPKPVICSLDDFPDLAVEFTDKRSGLNYWRFFDCEVESVQGQRYNARHVWDSLVEQFGQEIQYARSNYVDEHGFHEGSEAIVTTPWNNITSVIKRLEETAISRKRVTGQLNMGDSSILAELHIAGFFALYIDNGNMPDVQHAGWHGSVAFGRDKYSFRLLPRGKVFQDVVGQLEVRDEIVTSIEKFFATQFWYLAHQPIFTLERTILPTAPWFGKSLLG